MPPRKKGLFVYGVLGKSCPWGAMLSRVPGWEGEASPPTAKACSPRGEDMLSRWNLKVACPRKAAAKAWHPADNTFSGCYRFALTAFLGGCEFFPLISWASYLQHDLCPGTTHPNYPPARNRE